MTNTYRKFDRIRGDSSFIVVNDNFETFNANRWISTGVGTPVAPSLGTNGGLVLTTTAASGDSNIVQKGIESAATKLVSIDLKKGKKVAAIGRVEHADFLNMDIAFGLAPALANPFAGSASIYAILGSTTNSVVMGANTYTPDVAVTLPSLMDRFGGINFELYFDGQAKLGLFAGGQRIGGFRNLTFDVNKFLTGFTAPLALSIGVISRSAAAKTVLIRKLGYAKQILPDVGVPA